MAKSPAVRSSEVQYDGAGMLLVISSGKLDLVNAVAEQGAFLVPFDAEIVEVRSRVRTACGTAAGLAELKGVEAGATVYASKSHATTDAAGTDLVWTTAVSFVPKGEVLYFAGDGGATATGDCDVTVILKPKAGA